MIFRKPITNLKRNTFSTYIRITHLRTGYKTRGKNTDKNDNIQLQANPALR